MLLTQLKVIAQFSGGNEDGSSVAILTQSNCAALVANNAFYGGPNDGSSIAVLTQTNCPSLLADNAFYGGPNDGSSIAVLTQTNCPSLLANSVFYGGINDGSSIAVLTQTNCPSLLDNSVFYGGIKDGSSFAVLTQTNCPSLAADFVFHGGAKDGASAVKAIQTDPTIATAGGTQTICANASATVPSAFASYSTFIWTHNGAGEFANNGSGVPGPTSTLLLPTYVAAAGDAGNTVTLIITVFNGICINASALHTIIVKPFPTATAGGSATICQNSSHTVTGASSSNGTRLWTHNGTGNLTNATTLTPTYTASPADIGNAVILTLSVTSASCTTAVATYTINVSGNPIATAGGTQTICVTQTATVPAASSTNGTVLWTHNGSGQFANNGLGVPGATSTLLTPSYIPAAGDAGLTRTLTMTVSSPSCPNAVAIHTVIIRALPTAVAGGSATICQNGSHLVSGVTTSNGSRLWTHNGAGTFNGGAATSTLLLPTYFASAADAGNTVTLTLTVANSPCVDAVASYTINVAATPIAVAGGSQTICENETATVLSASATNGTFVWTHNGLGQYADDGTGNPGAISTLLTPTYVPAAGDAGFTRTLTMTVSNSPCANNVATHTVIIKALPIAVAGGSATICQGNSHTVTGASSSNGSRLWTHDGAGTLTNPTSLSPIYNSTVADAGNTVTLTMTVSNAPCVQASATYQLIVLPANSVAAGGAQTICETASATVPFASSNTPNFLWTHNGNGQFADDGTGNPGATSTILQPTYLPASGDGGNTVILSITASNPPCVNVAANHLVVVEASPTALAGGNAVICVNSSHTVTGVSASGGTRLWTHNGAGSFNGGLATSTLLLPTYTAAAGDANNTVTLKLTVSNLPCADAVASYTIDVTPQSIASGAGPLETCENSAITVSGASATNGIISWSILNGNGSLANTGTLTPTYTPVAADAGTTVILRLSVSSPPCADAIYDQEIQIRPRPVLNPASVNICTGNPSQQIDVLSPQPNTDYKWSPANDLYLDGALTVPYTLGTAASTVWTAPFGNVNYNVTATNTTDNCTTGATQVAVTVCPAANDAICQALPVNVTSTASFVSYGLTGSTPSIFPSCAPVARDIYFSSVVPANGEIDVVTLPGTNSNSSLNMVSSVVQILTGACTSPSLVVCNSNGGSGNMSFASASGLTPGATIYIRLARTGGPTTAQFVRMAVTNGLVWTAAADDDFNNPANWHGGDATSLTKPGATISAIIPSTVTKPKLYVNSTARGMNFTTGAPFFVSPGINLNAFTLSVKGNWLVGPSIASSVVLDCNGTVEFNGNSASAQTIAGKTTFGNLTTNNTVGGVSLTSGTGVSCILKTTAGNFNSSGFLTLRSNNTTTALVHPLAGNISGNVNVERKIGSTSGYHYLSSPVSNAFINNTTSGWRDDFTILSSLDGIVFIPGTTYTVLPSVWEYNETNTNPNSAYGWIAATGVDDQITPLKGFACIVSANTVTDVFGPLNNGVISGGYNITKTPGTGTGEGLNAIGNPYASPISWNAFRALPGNNAILSTSGYQAFISSGGYAGAYGSWDGSIGSPISVTDKIASSQGIMVTALATGIINAANSVRLTTAADLNPTFFNGYNSVPDLIRMEVQGNGYANETAIYFDAASVDNFDIHRDARFVTTPVADVPAVYSYIDNTPLNINVMGALSMDKVVPLGLKIQTAGTYNLVATDMSSFSPSAIAYLEDTQAGTLTNLRTSPSYSITLPSGAINNRFFLHFHPAVELTASSETCAGNDGKLEINYPTTNTVDVVIKDENGNVVSTQNNLTGTVIIDNLMAGNYIAEMTFGEAPNTYTTADYFTVASGNAVYASLSASTSTVDLALNTAVNFTTTAQSATSFNWNFGDGTVISNGPANLAHTFAQAGTYNVTFEASNGICNTAATTTVEVTNATGLVAINNINLQVVGVGSKITVRFGNKMEGNGNIEVINLLGEVVARFDNVSMKGTKEIEMSNIAAGQYMVKISSKNNLYTEKVFLNHQ